MQEELANAMQCQRCNGTGAIARVQSGDQSYTNQIPCPECKGSGAIS